MYIIQYSYYKNTGYVWRGIKTNPRPKNSTASGPRPLPRFEIPGSATVFCPRWIFLIYYNQIFDKRTSCLYFCVVCLLFLVLFKNMHIQQAPKSTSTHVEFISFLYSKHPYKQYKINLYKLMSFTQFLPPFDLSRCPFPVLIVSFSLLVAVPAL